MIIFNSFNDVQLVEAGDLQGFEPLRLTIVTVGGTPRRFRKRV
jgi:hypothetical protein